MSTVGSQGKIRDPRFEHYVDAIAIVHWCLRVTTGGTVMHSHPGVAPGARAAKTRLPFTSATAISVTPAPL